VNRKAWCWVTQVTTRSRDPSRQLHIPRTGVTERQTVHRGHKLRDTENENVRPEISTAKTANLHNTRTTVLRLFRDESDLMTCFLYSTRKPVQYFCAWTPFPISLTAILVLSSSTKWTTAEGRDNGPVILALWSNFQQLVQPESIIRPHRWHKPRWRQPTATNVPHSVSDSHNRELC